MKLDSCRAGFKSLNSTWMGKERIASFGPRKKKEKERYTVKQYLEEIGNFHTGQEQYGGEKNGQEKKLGVLKKIRNGETLLKRGWETGGRKACHSRSNDYRRESPSCLPRRGNKEKEKLIGLLSSEGRNVVVAR